MSRTTSEPDMGTLRVEVTRSATDFMGRQKMTWGFMTNDVPNNLVKLDNYQIA